MFHFHVNLKEAQKSFIVKAVNSQFGYKQLANDLKPVITDFFMN